MKSSADQGLKVLAVASSGGHWVQMQRALPGFDDNEIVFVAVHEDYRSEVGGRRLYVVNDANRLDKLGSLKLGWRVLRVVLRERPDVVFSTGAAPGLFAIIFGRLLGARTIWLDSIANADRLSLSGKLARPFAELWLTQWPDLAEPGGPEYAGRVF